MLILKRKKLQTIIAGDVKVHVMEIGKGYVSIGIEAPREVKIYRAELQLLEVAETGPQGAD